MPTWLSLAVRLFAALVTMLALIGAPALFAAQSTIDPSIDSDGDGTNNQRDFDDDNDLIVDDEDCDPFDAAIGRQCPQPTTRPEPTTAPQAIPTAQPTSPPPTSAPDPDPDNDGDGIANRVDPDDDNDGVTDEHDSAPLDPNAGTNPPSSIIDPDDDNDGDGIANSHDPDDDNDGVTDDIDCAPFDASVTTCPTPAPGQPAAEPGQPASSGSSTLAGGAGDSLFVTTLPTTGIGTSTSEAPLVVWILLALAGAGIGWMLTRKARHDVPRVE